MIIPVMIVLKDLKRGIVRNKKKKEVPRLSFGKIMKPKYSVSDLVDTETLVNFIAAIMRGAIKAEGIAWLNTPGGKYYMSRNGVSESYLIKKSVEKYGW